MTAQPERRADRPPSTWQEHWFDHRQLLRLYHDDEDCAIYTDPDVRLAQVRWLPGYIGQAWRYSKATYGDAFGPDPRIYSIHHAGRHGGGHAGYYVSPVHDHRNVSDCGLDSWREGNALAPELPAHEIGHTVESANNGTHGSPAYEIWGDSKWAEFYIYDLYTALGMRRHARRVHRQFIGNADDFPRPGTRWFRDWFYPLWRDCGQAAVMARFFSAAGRALPPRRGRDVHPADGLGRVHPLHQRRRGRGPERPGRPRLRLAARAERPGGARAGAVSRGDVLQDVAQLKPAPGAFPPSLFLQVGRISAHDTWTAPGRNRAPSAGEARGSGQGTRGHRVLLGGQAADHRHGRGGL